LTAVRRNRAAVQMRPNQGVTLNMGGKTMDDRVVAARKAAALYADNRYRRCKGAFKAALYHDMAILQAEMVLNHRLLERGRKAVRAQ
jgi:phosphoserine aminotransferase